MSLVTHFLKSLVPAPIKATLKRVKIQEIDYGYWRSGQSRSCVDKDGNPIAWYTFPALEYIGQLDFSGKTIFEYGGGNSTLFWSKLAKKVISIEDDPVWYQVISKTASANVEIRLVADKTSYINEILKEDLIDVVIVDGSHRYECAQQAVKRLKVGGVIILDNSDWFVKTASLLREADLIQVDMTGFAPLNFYTSTTSFFLHREFRFGSRNTDQPVHGIGSLNQYGQE